MAMNSLCVDNIVEEISSVLSKHLLAASQAINKIQEEKKDLETLLLEIPYVKNLKIENQKLKLELEKITKSDKNIKKILLEVNEKNDISNDYSVSEETIIKEIEDDLEKKRKEQMDEMVNKLKMKPFDGLNGFSILDDDYDENDDDDDDDDDDEEEEEDDEDDEFCDHGEVIVKDNSLVCKDYNEDTSESVMGPAEIDRDLCEENKYIPGILLAQSNIDTIDDGTDSAEEEEVEDEEEVDDEEKVEEEVEDNEEEVDDEEEVEDNEEEVDDEEEEEEVEDDEEEVEDEEEEEEVEEDEEEEEEVEEIKIEGKKFYGNERNIGDIYEYLEDGDVGDVVGHYVNGCPILINE